MKHEHLLISRDILLSVNWGFSSQLFNLSFHIQSSVARAHYILTDEAPACGPLMQILWHTKAGLTLSCQYFLISIWEGIIGIA